MRNTRKIIAGLLLAAGLAATGGITYAQTETPATGACPYGGPGAGYGPGMMGGGPRGGYGPGMMGGGPRGGYGPGMMGGGPRGGYGPGMMGGGPRGGYGPGFAQGGPAANVDARLAFLKNELAITADQESAWQAFAKQTKQQAESMQALRGQATAAAKTAPERLEQRAEFAKQRAANMEARSAALKDLYAALTPEQKAVADQHFGGWRMAQRGPRGYGRWR